MNELHMRPNVLNVPETMRRYSLAPVQEHCFRGLRLQKVMLMSVAGVM